MDELSERRHQTMMHKCHQINKQHIWISELRKEKIQQGGKKDRSMLKIVERSQYLKCFI